MKTASMFAASIALFLLVGAGCAVPGQPTQSDTPETNTKMAEQPDEATSMEEKDSMMEQKEQTAGDITLKAEAVGSGQVQFTWETEKELTDEQRFILVRDTDANPVHSGNNFWFRVHSSKREVIWVNNPIGEMHYRICITANDNPETCEAYSNDVTVDVK